jgi:hypothetical protein
MRITEEGLNDYLERWMRRRYAHALDGMFFTGTVAQITGTSTNCCVSVRRTGETQPDGNSYQVAPSYPNPAIDDRIELCWRDNAIGYALWKIPN